MMLNRFSFLLVCFLCISYTLFAQNHAYSYSECLSLSQHNIGLQIAQMNVSKSEKEMICAKDAFIPTLSLSNQHSISVGRSLDPTTYQFVTNQSVYDMSASIVGSVVLFSGLERLHTIKQAELNLESTRLEFEKVRNDLAKSEGRIRLMI